MLLDTRRPKSPGVLGHAAFPCFDGLRALAALSVFAYHSTGILRAEDPELFAPWLLNWLNRLGFFGVAVFFVISGFLLYRPFAAAALAGRPPPKLLPFWTRRFARIFPAYWAVLAFVVVVLVGPDDRVGSHERSGVRAARPEGPGAGGMSEAGRRLTLGRGTSGAGSERPGPKGQEREG